MRLSIQIILTFNDLFKSYIWVIKSQDIFSLCNASLSVQCCSVVISEINTLQLCNNLTSTQDIDLKLSKRQTSICSFFTCWFFGQEGRRLSNNHTWSHHAKKFVDQNENLQKRISLDFENFAACEKFLPVRRRRSPVWSVVSPDETCKY